MLDTMDSLGPAHERREDRWEADAREGLPEGRQGDDHPTCVTPPPPPQRQISAREPALMEQALNPTAVLWEIQPDALEMTVELGRGSFGTVRLGRWRRARVAVKALSKDAASLDARLFEREVELMVPRRADEAKHLSLDARRGGRRPATRGPRRRRAIIRTSSSFSGTCPSRPSP